jgi:hypothetical protein
MSNPFTEHPKEVGMNYFQHLLFAFSVVGKLIAAVFCCTIHAFFPFIFTHTTSSIVKNLHGLIDPTQRHK